MQVGRSRLLPLCDGFGADVFIGGGEIGRDTQTGGGAAGGEQGFDQLVVTIGRFDKDLGAVEALGFGLEVFYSFGTAGNVYGQIAGEAELLTVEAATHQGKQYAAGADERMYGYACLVGGFGEDLAGIGDTGAACLADKADGFPFL